MIDLLTFRKFQHSELENFSLMASSSAFAFPSYIITKGASIDSCKSTSFSSFRSLSTYLPSPCPRPNSNFRLLFSRPISSGSKYQSAKLVEPEPSAPKNWLTNAKQACVVERRSMMMGLLMSGLMVSEASLPKAFASTSVFKEYIDTFDGYSFKYPQNWIQVRGAGADIFFRDPVVLDENLSVEFSSPSSSKYLSLEDLGSPEEAGKTVLRQYLTEFMSTRLGVRRKANILNTSSRVADDGKLYYQIEVNIKSYANNNELAVMPEDRVARLEWNRRYLAVLGVENNRLYSLRLQTPEKVFLEEEKDLRRVMDSFRVEKI